MQPSLRLCEFIACNIGMTGNVSIFYDSIMLFIIAIVSIYYMHIAEVTVCTYVVLPKTYSRFLII